MAHQGHVTDKAVIRRHDSVQRHCLVCSYVVSFDRTISPNRDSLKLAQHATRPKETLTKRTFV